MTVAADPRKTGITGGMTLLAASAVALSVSNTTSEEAIVTISVPPPGIHGGIEIRTVWSVTNSANTKTLRIRLGGAAGTAFYGATFTASASVSDVRRIRNRGSASSQVGSASASATGFVSSSGAIPTASVDWSVAQDLVISGQKALGTENLTLESYEIWGLA